LPLGTLTAGVNYDIFAYASSGSVLLDPPVAWTNDTTRATALTRQNGILIKSGAPTRRYLGTFRTTSTTTTEDSSLKRFVFNITNQLPRSLRRIESTSSWNYGSHTLRPANNSTTNRVEVLIGDLGPLVNLHVQEWGRSTVADYIAVAIGEDSTSAASPNAVTSSAGTDSSSPTLDSTLSSHLVVTPTVGYHYYQWLESGSPNGITLFRGTAVSGGVTTYGGMIGVVNY